jgi:hypothetical protein
MADTIEIIQGTATTVEVAGQTGPQGPAGSNGANGQGVPVGGTTGQVLRKVSGTSYDTEWAAAASGSGSVTSVALAGTGLSISGSPVTTSGTITANVVYGTTAGTAAEGNDSRIVNILKSGTSDGGSAGGTGGSVNLAGGNALSGTGAGGAAGSINLSGGNAIYDAGEEVGHVGTVGGSIDLSGGAGGGGGSITMRGAANADGNTLFNAGSINLSAGGAANQGNSSGGSITSTGGIASNQNGGSLNMSGGQQGEGGSINTSEGGGSINTSGSQSGFGGSINTSEGGGSINTSGGQAGFGGSINTSEGGSINTSEGGGSINTRGTGSIELGVSATRTTLTGTATTARAISLPDSSGTLATTAQAADYEVTDSAMGIILKSPNNTRWRLTINNDGTLSRAALALMTLLAFATSGVAQVRDMVTDASGNIVTGLTNVLTFTNRVTIPISSGAATTNSILTADGAGSSAFVAGRTVTRFTTNDQTRTNWGFNAVTQSTNNDTQMGSWSLDANSFYRVEYAIAWVATTNSGFAHGIAFSTNLSEFNHRTGVGQTPIVSVTAITAGTNATTIGLANVSAASSGGRFAVAGFVYVLTSSNANTMNYRWYPINNSADATTLVRSSMISVTKMSP